MSWGWERLEALAWWRLNHAASLEPAIPAEYPLLRLWDDAGGFAYPTVPSTLTVFSVRVDEGAELVVREARWDATANLSAEETPTDPTIAIRDGRVDGAELDAALREAAGLRLPLVSPDRLVGVTSDVGAVGLELFTEDQPPAVLRLQWSHGTPAEWGPVIEWAGRLRGLLERALGRPE
jgi:hypothetical protein